MGDHNFLGDRPQHNGQDLGLEAHEHDQVETLDVGTRDNDSLPGDYPMGVSEMPIDGAGGWPTLGTVKTTRFVLDLGDPEIQTEWTHQVATSAIFDKTWIRSWFEDLAFPEASVWDSWKEQLTKSQADNLYVNAEAVQIEDDAHEASVGLVSYPQYISHMRLTASFASTNGWPGEANDKLVVTLYHNYNVFRGIQTIYDLVDGSVQQRRWTGSAWSGWGGFNPTTFTHIQTPASDTWVVDHMLGRIPMSVSIIDSAGNEVIAEIHHTSINQLVASFGSAFSGELRCG